MDHINLHSRSLKLVWPGFMVIQLCQRRWQRSYEGGFPVMAENTRNHIFSKEISQVIIAAMVLAPNFYWKNCLRVISAMRGNPPWRYVQVYYSVSKCWTGITDQLIQAGASAMQGIVKLLHLVFFRWILCIYILDFLFSHDLNWPCCL